MIKGDIMKKIALVLLTVVCGMFMGCTRGFENFKNNYTYINPTRNPKATYTIIQNGIKITGMKCKYWSTSDDDAVFEAPNGKLVFVNGSSLIFEE